MAYKILSSETVAMESGAKPIIEAILDAADDLEALGSNYYPGSVAIVADKDGPVYMLNASGDWREQ